MKWTLRRLEPDESRPEFSCGTDELSEDLNEFFAQDSIESAKQLLSVTYVVEIGGEVVLYFCVSNDAIRRDDTSQSVINRLLKPIPREKRYKSMPAVKIGRFATKAGLQSNNIGSEVLDFIKAWFTRGNKTGCRFIIVDAYNNPRTIHFYEKNRFKFLLVTDKEEDTRLMYFDLITFAQE